MARRGSGRLRLGLLAQRAAAAVYVHACITAVGEARCERLRTDSCSGEEDQSPASQPYGRAEARDGTRTSRRVSAACSGLQTTRSCRLACTQTACSAERSTVQLLDPTRRSHFVAASVAVRCIRPRSRSRVRGPLRRARGGRLTGKAGTVGEPWLEFLGFPKRRMDPRRPARIAIVRRRRVGRGVECGRCPSVAGSRT